MDSSKFMITEPEATGRESGALSMGERLNQLRNTSASKKNQGLDFVKERKNYQNEFTKYVPFVKSTFVHYCKNPEAQNDSDDEMGDTIVTMQLIEAPQSLTYKSLKDPKVVKIEDAKKKKEQAKYDKMLERKAKREEKAKLRKEMKEKAKEEERLARQRERGGKA